MTTTTAYDRVVERLDGVRRTGATTTAKCPAHDDHTPSLGITRADQRVLLHCFAGCEIEAVVDALGLNMRDLYDTPRPHRAPDHWLPHDLDWVASYDYTDASRRLIYQVIRATAPNGNRTFVQRRPEGTARSGWAWDLNDLTAEQRCVPYRLPDVLSAGEQGQTVWVVEGEKDAEALCGAGVVATTNAGGAGNWTGRHAEHLRGTHVVITRDQDTPGRQHQAQVSASLDGIAASVRLVEPACGKDVAEHLAAGFGLDDFVSVETGEDVGGRTQEQAEQSSHVPTQADPDPYADSPISVRVVAESMRGRWLWTSAFGWMAWTGCVWDRRDDVAAAEVVRRWVDAEVVRIALKGDKRETENAAALQAENRINRILRLCRGQVLTDAAEFDQDRDVLVAANGVIDLRSGELLAHDPARLVTRMTPVDYTPDAVHADWMQALTAVPDDVRDWIQIRFGQASTGHTPDDDRMIMFQGAGSNGKSTLLDAVVSALGDYATTVPDKLLLGSPGDHPTELMSLRGRRLAVVEETPEARRLSISRLKKIVGTPSIAARPVYHDTTTFRATHALIITSNYLPVVEEVDHGTWRRLGLVRFPFRFRPAKRDCKADRDRHGDARMRSRLLRDAQQEAVLAWLVAGAQQWYTRGQEMPPLPGRVEHDIDEWRAETDAVMAYARERLIPDPQRCIMTSDLTADLGQWLESHGQTAWSERTVASRFGGHEWVEGHRVEKGRGRRDNSMSRPQYRAMAGTIPQRFRAWVGVRFRTAEDDLAKRGTAGTTSSQHIPDACSAKSLDGLSHLSQTSNGATHDRMEMTR